MKLTDNHPWIDDVRRYRWAGVFLCLVMVACSSRQAYEGLKSGHRSSCLEYPESEYQDCVDESNTNYHDYQRQREEIIDD